MRRLLAFAVAAAMVGGSLWLRNGGDDSGGGPGGDGAAQLTCATELETVCEALAGDGVEVTVEPAPETADRLIKADEADLDGWLVPAPWPDIVQGARERAARRPLFEATGAPLARSRLALVVWKDRAARLGDECGGPVGWKCLGDVADKPWKDLGGREDWGPVKLGHGDLGADATALLVLGQAVAAYFGRTDLSSIDLEDPGFDSWVGRLEGAVRVPAAGSGLETMLTAGPAQYDAVGTLDAEARSAVATSARRKNLDLLYPSPMITADVVLATVAGERGRRLAAVVRSDDGRRALAGAGWDVPGRAGAPMPPPGFLEALRQEVQR